MRETITCKCGCTEWKLGYDGDEGGFICTQCGINMIKIIGKSLPDEWVTETDE